MPEYAEKFKRLLREELDISRNRDDARIVGDVPPEEFDVDPMSADVGFRSNNMERDRGNLDKIISEVETIIDKLPTLSQELAKLERSFDGIGQASKTVATINQKLYDMMGELQGYIISLPAQKNDKEDEMEVDMEGDF